MATAEFLEEPEVDLEKIATSLSTILASSDILQYRINNLNAMIDQETFEFSNIVLKNHQNDYIPVLLRECSLSASSNNIIDFLKAFNKWLVNTRQVDLNDLHIIPNTLVQNAFGISSKKVPYGYLLTCLPRMFY